MLFVSNISQRVLSFMYGDAAGIMGGDSVVADTAGEIAEAVNGAVNQIAAAPPAEGGSGMWVMIAYAGVLVIAMYFLMFRGPRKREKKMKELQASIRTGDNVVVTGGMFGRVADVGDDCYVVEFGSNRSIRIPVLKTDVLGIREPKLTPPPKIDTDK
ncbi:MAG: preprotein translocase subunit YajC [Defluviitaleaceae bacterium]|nr:preprotein translocase subunit YajC [Defluviitaleaceae bacterium]